jgi:electron transport complex protein RnfC
MPAFRFHGGVHPPAPNPARLDSHSVGLPIPERVILPLQSIAGRRFRPRVKPGQHVKTGQVVGIAEESDEFPLHATVSGRVEEFMGHPTPYGTDMPTLSIRSDPGRQHPVPGDLHESHDSPSVDEMLERIREAGVSGMGGSGTPTHTRLARAQKKHIAMVIVNGTETDPALSSDFRTMAEHTKDLISGIQVLLSVTGASRAVVALTKRRAAALPSLRKQIRRIKAVSVSIVEDRYPVSHPFALIRCVTGKNLRPGDTPADVGLYLQNASTTVALSLAVRRRVPLVERIVTVCGDGIREPKNIRVRIGTPIRDVIKHCGGAVSSDVRLLAGGPMRGRMLRTDEVPVLADTPGIMVMRIASPLRPDPLPCITCGRCVTCCPMRLVPFRIAHFATLEDVGGAFRHGIDRCIHCGCCSYICPSMRPLSAWIAALAADRFSLHEATRT